MSRRLKFNSILFYSRYTGYRQTRRRPTTFGSVRWSVNLPSKHTTGSYKATRYDRCCSYTQTVCKRVALGTLTLSQTAKRSAMWRNSVLTCWQLFSLSLSLIFSLLDQSFSVKSSASLWNQITRACDLHPVCHLLWSSSLVLSYNRV